MKRRFVGKVVSLLAAAFLPLSQAGNCRFHSFSTLIRTCLSMISRLALLFLAVSCVFGHMDHDLGDLHNATCVVEPSTDGCANYTLPTTDDDIHSLCMEMPYMIGCSLQTICSSNHQDSEYCKPFSILKTLCIDMPGMSGCQNYLSMCNTSSIVEECNTKVLPVPTTMEASNYIYAICSSHSMDVCSKCHDHGETTGHHHDHRSSDVGLRHDMPDCNYLEVYSGNLLVFPTDNRTLRVDGRDENM